MKCKSEVSAMFLILKKLGYFIIASDSTTSKKTTLVRTNEVSEKWSQSSNNDFCDNLVCSVA